METRETHVRRRLQNGLKPRFWRSVTGIAAGVFAALFRRFFNSRKVFHTLALIFQFDFTVARAGYKPAAGDVVGPHAAGQARLKPPSAQQRRRCWPEIVSDQSALHHFKTVLHMPVWLLTLRHCLLRRRH